MLKRFLDWWRGSVKPALPSRKSWVLGPGDLYRILKGRK